MKNYIYRDKEFKILSKTVDNATKCMITDVFDDGFSVELYTEEDYKTNESVELYSITDMGLLYFETIVKEIQGRVLRLWAPPTYKFLQRREYTRVPINKDLVLVSQTGEEIMVSLLDISAGGLKLASPKQLELSSLYDIELELERNKKIICKFQPVRMEVNPQVYIVSGRFQLLTNVDRVWLVQFCFKKQLEENNK